MGMGFWILYLALEPFARRRWPQMLISWTRGPLAGAGAIRSSARDLLIGALVGTTRAWSWVPLRVLLPLGSGSPARRRILRAVGESLATAIGLASRGFAVYSTRSGSSASFSSWSWRAGSCVGIGSRRPRDALCSRGNYARRRRRPWITLAVSPRSPWGFSSPSPCVFGVLSGSRAKSIFGTSSVIASIAATLVLGLLLGMIAVAPVGRRSALLGGDDPRSRDGR